MDKKNVIILLAVVLLVGLVVFSLRSRINLSLGLLVKKVDFKNDTVFKNYKIQDVKIGNDYAVQLRDIVAGTGDGVKRYYRIDMTITVTDRSSQKMIVKNDALTAAVIANTLSEFKVSDVSTAKGKEFLKSTIKKNLEAKYGGNFIKDVYFEKFIYN
ncbi:flagellar basal body-associated FliL family protein [Deferribacterales bacterium Es71-Z0220]|jgi:flagellar basal body-associated protein FliL|uniref:flagellar basal body-associated FliL family protein n=1 Tax=Deferrivibrio essentukiensis TaxID=2880922 RepID=UPI001F61B803|nr:flagellar basal body-associated FliL family protein [Deferrivibrio essentukiensis]MCB4205335.1 flagellar basal body-associated FliL family protein [Deferrivibrio essentukiensis]